MVVSEPFEATDANGINVTGTVDVGRERDGDFFNPASPHYKQPRFSNYRFQYFNTRDACKIDPETLKAAMEQALENALMRFGIKEPDRGTIRKDVHNSVEATRQQCAKNVDKFVSNETFSAADWETGKAVGPVTARAYAAVPTPDGGVRKVVVRENTWPADFPAAGNDPTLAPAELPDAGRNPGDADSKPVRYLSRRIAGRADTSVFDQGAPALPFVPADGQFQPVRPASFDDRFANRTDSGGGTAPRDPYWSVPSAEEGRPRGIVSGEPMPRYPFPPPIFGPPQSAVPDDEDWLTQLLAPRRGR